MEWWWRLRNVYVVSIFVGIVTIIVVGKWEMLDKDDDSKVFFDDMNENLSSMISIVMDIFDIFE